MRGPFSRALSSLRLGSSGYEGAQAIGADFSHNVAYGLSVFGDKDSQSSKNATYPSYQRPFLSEMMKRSLTTSSMQGVPPPGTRANSDVEYMGNPSMHDRTSMLLPSALDKTPGMLFSRAKSFQKMKQQMMSAPYSTASPADDHHHEIHDLRVQNHPFHVLPESWWPMMAAFSSLNSFMGMVLWWHAYPGGFAVFLIGMANVTLTAMNWWRDMCIESQMGMHTDIVRDNMTAGMYWFILSEAMLFFGLLWSCVHVGMAPNVGVHMQWPPVGIHGIEWDKRALVMSAVLAASYFSANLAMYSKPMLWATVGMGGLFLASQYIEYSTAPFTITDSAYGSTFYMTTGFHGLHVFLGSIYLAICALMKPTTYGPSIGLRNAILYWHFVDIVWIGVYGIIYIGGY